MSRKYKTIVYGSDLIALQWGAVDDSGNDVQWVSGTITILDATGRNVILTATAAVSVDRATLSWVPNGLPAPSAPTPYKVRWHGISSAGSDWYSRPLIEWTVEPQP